MKIVRRGEGRMMPWKNGTGVSFEVAVAHDGVGEPGFVWRISLAVCLGDTAALLSDPGLDRTLVMMEGKASMLDFGGGTVTLDMDSAPLSFPGEAPATVWLTGRPAIGLDVVTRRGCVRHRVDLIEMRPGTVLPDDCTAVVCRSGAVTVDALVLHPCDAAVWPAGQTNPRIGGAGEVAAIVITGVAAGTQPDDIAPGGLDRGIQIDAPPRRPD